MIGQRYCSLYTWIASLWCYFSDERGTIISVLKCIYKKNIESENFFVFKFKWLLALTKEKASREIQISEINRNILWAHFVYINLLARNFEIESLPLIITAPETTSFVSFNQENA